MPVKVKDVLDALHQIQNSLECSICLELLKDPYSTKCNHQFCGQCIKQVLEKSSSKSKNKWFCPLCKTPVSKRSLTPNPKLSEIVAAVRGLQEAVQEDIPTVDEGGQNAANQQDQFESNINVSLSFGPPTRKNNKRSKKATNMRTTKTTRSTGRKKQQSTSNELLHMIDTMSFQPVSKGGPCCPGFDGDEPTTHDKQVPVKDNLQRNGDDEANSNKAAEVHIYINDDCEKAAAVSQPSSSICITTIAEADSSVKTGRCKSHELKRDKNSVHACDTRAIFSEVREVVSSTEFDLLTESNLDKMQSVSLLFSFDGRKEQSDTEPVDGLGIQCKDGPSMVMEEHDRIPLEQGYQYKQREVLAEPQISEKVYRSNGNPAALSMNFDGLVSLLEDPCFNVTDENGDKSEDVKLDAIQDRSQEERISHVRSALGSGEAESSNRHIETASVSQCLESLDSAKQWKPNAKKRCADSDAEISCVEQSNDECTRKRFKNYGGSIGQLHSVLKNTTSNDVPANKCSGCERERIEVDRGTGDTTSAQNCNETLTSGSKLSSGGSKSIASDEMIPASATSAETCHLSVINPMIPYTDVLNKAKSLSEGKSKDCGYSNDSKKRTHSGDHSQELLGKYATLQGDGGRGQETPENNHTGDGSGIFSSHDFVTSFKKSEHCLRARKRNLLASGCQRDSSSRGNFDSEEDMDGQAEDDDRVKSFSSQESVSTRGNLSGFPCEISIQDGLNLEMGSLKSSEVKSQCRHNTSNTLVPDSKTMPPSSSAKPQRFENVSKLGFQDEIQKKERMDQVCSGKNVSSKESSQKQTPTETNSATNTPATLSSVEIDVLTPCLFGSYSLEKNEMLQSKISIAQSLIKNATGESGNLPPDKKSNVVIDETQLFSVKVQNSPNFARLLATDGAISSDSELQSSSTSQSISVLHDLEILPPVKLFSKKPAGILAAHKETLGWTRSSRRDLSCDDDTECLESDVIPPTPPVQAVPKQVYGSIVQSTSLRASCSKTFQPTYAKQICSPSFVSAKSMKSELDENGTQLSSVDSEASISLLKNQSNLVAKSPPTTELTKGFECNSNTDSSLKAKHAPSAFQDNKAASPLKSLENTLHKPSRNLRIPGKSSSENQRRFCVSSQVSNNDPLIIEDKTHCEITKPSIQPVNSSLVDGKLCDKASCRPLSSASVNASPCNPAQEKREAKNGFGNSNWPSHANETWGENQDNDDYEEFLNLERKNKNHGDGEFLSITKREADGRDSTIVDNLNNAEESIATEAVDGDSSSDDDLLQSVFLPNEDRVHRDNTDYEKDDYFEVQEPPAFSQELISSQDEELDDGITSSCKAVDRSTGTSSTFLSEPAASTQKMEVLRKDVEAMEREMEELRAYLAKTEGNREEVINRSEDDGIGLNRQEHDHCECDPDLLLSLTPPPPLTPKSIPPMPQLSSPLKDVSRYLDQEGKSFDEDSDSDMPDDFTKNCTSSKDPCKEEKASGGNDNYSSSDCLSKPSPFTPDEENLLSVTAPARPGTNHFKHRPNCQEEELLVVDDSSVQLVKRTKLAHDLIPKKSPVVNLLFANTGKRSEKAGQSLRLAGLAATKRTAASRMYSDTMYPTIAPIEGQHETAVESRDQRESPDSRHAKLRVVTNTKDRSQAEPTPSRNVTTAHLSFVATRLNRRQLAEARELAESYGGKLASEFNSKTSHVILATDENMQVTRHSYTMKYLQGLALGKWIVSHYWITACIQTKRLVPEVNYEVKGDPGLGQAFVPRVARMARHTKKAQLFEGYHVLCVGSFSAAVCREQLVQLLKFCGARVFSNAESLKRIEKERWRIIVVDKESNECVEEITVLCLQLKTLAVSSEWVTDSIANYRVQDFRDYIISV